MASIYRYIVKLTDDVDFQGQVLIFYNFLCLGSGKGIGPGNCCVYYKCCFIVSVVRHYFRFVEIYHFISYDRLVPI